MHEVQGAIWCMNRSNLIKLTHTSYFTHLPLASLFINKLTNHWKFNNMHFMNLNMLYDIIHALNVNWNHPTKNEYFPKHIPFSTLYLLQEQKLNPKNYSE
jgi:hypothetical protein